MIKNSDWIKLTAKKKFQKVREAYKGFSLCREQEALEEVINAMGVRNLLGSMVLFRCPVKITKKKDASFN